VRLATACIVSLVALPIALSETLVFDTVSKSRVEARVRQCLRKNADRAATLKTMFEETGCQVTEQVVKGVKIPNVICTLQGATDSIILVGAHTDHTDYGMGMIDNWSGASLLPALYESLRNRPRRHTYVFIGFTEEEKGLKGSHYYANHMKPDESTRTKAMVNIDSVGLGPSAVWVSRSDKGLTSAAWIMANNLKLPLKAINVEQVGSSDSESFKELNIPRITFHSVTQDTLRILHSVKDTEKALHPDDYYETYRLLAAYLAYLDTILEKPANAP